MAETRSLSYNYWHNSPTYILTTYSRRTSWCLDAVVSSWRNPDHCILAEITSLTQWDLPLPLKYRSFSVTTLMTPSHNFSSEKSSELQKKLPSRQNIYREGLYILSVTTLTKPSHFISSEKSSEIAQKNWHHDVYSGSPFQVWEPLIWCNL